MSVARNIGYGLECQVAEGRDRQRVDEPLVLVRTLPA
jgi:ABC-type sulfate/molybdate transport systems ATPase subunit